MITVSWDSMFPELSPLINGAPYATLRSALAASASEFLAKSGVWIADVEAQNTVADTAQYDLVTDGGVIENLTSMELDGNALTKLVAEPRASFSSSGRPLYFWVVDGNVVELAPVPDGIYALTGQGVVKTALNASGVPDWVYSSYGDAIIDGAAWRLMRIPNKHWTDQVLARDHKMRFDRAICNANIHSRRGVDLRVQFTQH